MSNIEVSRGNVSLILGILSIITSFLSIGLVLGIIGLIYGIIDLMKIKRFKQNGNRKIVSGIICCLLGIIFTVIFSITVGKMLFS